MDTLFCLFLPSSQVTSSTARVLLEVDTPARIRLHATVLHGREGGEAIRGRHVCSTQKTEVKAHTPTVLLLHGLPHGG